MILALLAPLALLPLACNSNNPTAAGPVTLVLQQPAGSNPTATTTPFMIWQNGTADCFQGNCVTYQDTVSITGQVSFQVSGNNLELDSATATCWNGDLIGYLPNPCNATGYTDGHLQMDVKLGLSPATYGAITLGTFYASNVLDPTKLSSSSFTHVSVPTNIFLIPTPMNFGGTLFDIEVSTPNPSIYFPNASPLIYINNVEWTAN